MANPNAVKARRASRALLPTPLSLDEVSALLRAGFSGEHPSSWGRAAPSADQWQEVQVYAVTPDAAYRYEPDTQRLELVRVGDLRAATGTHDCVAVAPLHLVYVVDFNRSRDDHEEEHGILAGADAGSIVEKIHRHCAGAGLATVVRGRVDHRRAGYALRLGPAQRIVVAQAVGRAKVEAH